MEDLKQQPKISTEHLVIYISIYIYEDSSNTKIRLYVYEKIKIIE